MGPGDAVAGGIGHRLGKAPQMGVEVAGVHATASTCAGPSPVRSDYVLGAALKQGPSGG
ncbi:hypothetical protein GCM10019016_009000 [Streptomyces prasinosporus]|uniref:Uncharacterized protein n=1 Tax=Streptomyces prasinosporus TaxID=68256 RepID=A0ABP6TGY2_9ACTN